MLNTCTMESQASKATQPHYESIVQIKHLAVYAIGVLTLSTIAGFIMASGHSVGGLIFIVSPLLISVLLRIFGRTGWSNAGLRFSGSKNWYLVAVVALPLTFFIELLIGLVTGSVTAITNSLFSTILSKTSANLLPWLMFAICEEFGWRGYFDPTLEKFGVRPLRRYLITGLLWAAWHVPYILATPDYTSLAPIYFAPLFIGSVLLMAIVYGELRRRTNSVWPLVVAHGISNALAYALLDKSVLHIDKVVVFAPRPDSLLFIALWALFAWALLCNKKLNGGG